MENKSGDGKTSPYGNGAGGSSGVSNGDGKFDATKTPSFGTQGGAGAQDFTKEPSMADNKAGGQYDATKDPNPNGVPAADKGADCRNPQSIPSGGTLPWKGAPAPLESGRKPFKI